VEAAAEAAASAEAEEAEAAEAAAAKAEEAETEAAEAAQNSGSCGSLVTLVLEAAAKPNFGVVIRHDECFKFPKFVQSKVWNTRTRIPL
jgi:hypothetical protein